MQPAIKRVHALDFSPPPSPKKTPTQKEVNPPQQAVVQEIAQVVINRIDNVPTELLQHIFTFVTDPKDQLSLRQVSRLFKDIATPLLRKNICMKGV